MIIFIAQKALSDMRTFSQKIAFGHNEFRDLKTNPQLISALEELPVSPYKLCEGLEVLLLDKKEKKK
jgi:hypothetical protein